MRNVIILLLSAAVFTPVVRAQGISPLVQELHANKKGVASGEFKIMNRGLTPLAVTLEAKSLTWRDGKLAEVRPLDDGIVVELSETSTMIPIKSDHTISFKAVCPQPMCYFNIFSVQRPVRKNGAGIAIATALGEAVYICREHADRCRENFLKAHPGMLSATE